MGKRTLDKQDKAVRYIHEYQKATDGKTPDVASIRAAAGIPDGAWSYYRNVLGAARRIETISVAPLKMRINYTHPDNVRCLADLPQEPVFRFPALADPAPGLDPDFDEVPEPAPEFPEVEETTAEDPRRIVENQPSEVLVEVLIARGWDVTLRQTVKP